METTATGRPKFTTAKWGAACAACSTAKAKCIRSDSTPGAKCDRCQRLFKTCTKQVHRPRKKRETRPSRTAQLETKLNGLVEYLKTSGEWQKASHTLEDPNDSGASRGSPSPSDDGSDRPAHSSKGSSWYVPRKYNSHAPETCVCRAPGEDAPPPPCDDETLLQIFKTEFTAIHPFVVIPPQETAIELAGRAPFLMSSIRMVTSYRSLKSMRAQMYYLQTQLNDRLLIRSERSLELLQGLIVILGWYQYHCFLHSQLNNLVALMGSLVADLGIGRDVGSTVKIMLRGVEGGEDTAAQARRTNAEKRALAGAWFISSGMAVGFAQTESMRYTHYIDQCLKELAAAREYPSDVLLFNLVKVQHLTDRICRVASRDRSLDELDPLPSASPNVPLSTYITGFTNELDALVANLPPSVRQNAVLQVYINTARLRLNEPPVVESSLIRSICESLENKESDRPDSQSTLGRLIASADAIQYWFEHWLSIPATQYYLHSTNISAQIVYVIVMMSRWARLISTTKMHQAAARAISTSPYASRTASEASPYTEGSLTPGSSATASSSVSRGTEATARTSYRNPSEGKMPCQYGLIHPRPTADPELPSAVVHFRRVLAKQQSSPRLTIDCPKIIQDVINRFEEGSEILEKMSVEDGRTGHNIWSMSAMKVKITQAKLMKFAGMVEATEEEEKRQNMGLDESMAATTLYGQGPEIKGLLGHEAGVAAGGEPLFGVSAGPNDPMAGMFDMGFMGLTGEDTWMSDLMENMDPMLWADDAYGAWGGMYTGSF